MKLKNFQGQRQQGPPQVRLSFAIREEPASASALLRSAAGDAPDALPDSGIDERQVSEDLNRLLSVAEESIDAPPGEVEERPGARAGEMPHFEAIDAERVSRPPSAGALGGRVGGATVTVRSSANSPPRTDLAPAAAATEVRFSPQSASVGPGVGAGTQGAEGDERGEVDSGRDEVRKYRFSIELRSFRALARLPVTLARVYAVAQLPEAMRGVFARGAASMGSGPLPAMRTFPPVEVARGAEARLSHGTSEVSFTAAVGDVADVVAGGALLLEVWHK